MIKPNIDYSIKTIWIFVLIAVDNRIHDFSDGKSFHNSNLFWSLSLYLTKKVNIKENIL